MKNSFRKNQEFKGDTMALHEEEKNTKPQNKPENSLEKNDDIIDAIIPKELMRKNQVEKLSGFSKIVKRNMPKFHDIKREMDNKEIVEQTQKENLLSL